MTPTYPLDDYQQRVVQASERSIRMVAPAGSGKTETLARRVVARIDAGADQSRILLLTFDTNARSAILARLTALGAPAGVRVATLNAFGYGLLRTVFRDERTRIATGVFFPQTTVMSDLVKEYGHSVFSEMLSKIKNEAFDTRTVERQELATWCSKNREHLLRDLDDDPILASIDDRAFGRDLALEMDSYEQWLEGNNSIDFDDQKLRPYLRFLDDGEALARLQAQFDEVIVDEFQDINKLDALLVEQIAGTSGLLITGDDDQAIYGFRGATAEYLVQPKRHFQREFASYELSINYRCPPLVLKHATNLIEHNEHRLPKQPRAHKTEPGVVDVVKSRDTAAECDEIAKRLKNLQGRSAAVLVRRRSQFGPIQSALIAAGTPYQIEQREDVRISWSLARRALLIAPLTMGEVPDDGVRAEIVRIFGQARSMSPLRNETLARLATLDTTSFPGPELVQQLHERERSDLAAGLKGLVGEMSVEQRIESLDALLNTELRTYMDGGNDAKRSGNREPSRLSGLAALARQTRLGAVAFAAHIDKLLQPHREHYGSARLVELVTCHGAKGREWQVVCIPHCNHGIFPDSRSLVGPHLEAERKLFYVSMTRASEHLLLTWAERSADGRDLDPGDFLLEASLATPRPQPAGGRNGQRSRTFAANDTATVATKPRRDLGASGSWAMAPKPVTIAPPVRRYLTLASPAGLQPADVTDTMAIEALVTAIVRYGREGEVPLKALEIRYTHHDPSSTYPLQVALALGGTPFEIGQEDRCLDCLDYRQIIAAWIDSVPPLISARDADIRDAIGEVLRRHTGSRDPRVWRATLQRLAAADEIGNDPAGVRFVPH